MNKIITNAIAGLIILPFFINSCGKYDEKDDDKLDGGLEDEVAEGTLDGSDIDGIYMAKFITLNPHVNGTVPGSLTFYRKDDKLMTYVRLFAGGPKVWHQQGVYTGKRCPHLGDDLNRDGFIDIEEAMKVTGKMIIPLDANMNSQNAGKNFYPVADISGYYHYERISSFRRLFEDLRSEDKDLEDHITKLGSDEKFTFTGRVVMVQGVSEEVLFPESVAAIGKRKAFQTLPITCGIIEKVDKLPGIPDSGEIPGPVAEVLEGQDRPAAPGEGEEDPTTGGTIAGTTGSNENEEGEVGEGDIGGTTGGVTTGGATGSSEEDEGRSRTSGEDGSSSSGRGHVGGTGSGNSTGRTIGGFIGGFIGGGRGGDDESRGGRGREATPEEDLPREAPGGSTESPSSPDNT